MAYRHDVFLSYTTEFPYGNWVHDLLLPFLGGYLHNELRRRIDIFVDRDGIRAGDDWPARLKEALVHSKSMVAVWSPSYFDSKSCVAELAVMMYRERKLGYRTTANPGGIVLPIVVHDGEYFPETARKMQWLDCNEFARIGRGFAETPKYIEFQDKLRVWARGAASAIEQAPPWQEQFGTKRWLELAINSLCPELHMRSAKGYFPSLT